MKCKSRKTEKIGRKRDTHGDVGKPTMRGRDLRERRARRKKTRVAKRDRGTYLAV